MTTKLQLTPQDQQFIKQCHEEIDKVLKEIAKLDNEHKSLKKKLFNIRLEIAKRFDEIKIH
jgi:uncharacterized coiled-coil DUF342 family protein